MESRLLIIRILACGWEQGESKYNITIIISTCFSDRVHLQAGDLDLGDAREDVRGPGGTVALLVAGGGARAAPRHLTTCVESQVSGAALNCGCALCRIVAWEMIPSSSY